MSQGTAHQAEAGTPALRFVPEYSVLYGLALVLACLFGATPKIVLVLAVISLALTAIDCARRGTGFAALATFLPALPLAAWLQFRDGLSTGAFALAAVAIALQTRHWLLLLSAQCNQDRASLAKKLSMQQPSRAKVFVDNDIESEIDSSALREGHLLRVAPGERIPADGMVTFGSSFVDENLLPGEAEDLKMKGMGSLVYAGSKNRNGSLLIRASAVGPDSFAARLAARLRTGPCTLDRRLALADLLLVSAAATVTSAKAGPGAALEVFLVASSVGLLAVRENAETALAYVSAARRWLWSARGLLRLSRCGMVISPVREVLTENRLRLSAVEYRDALSEDAVLGLLGPLARKLETPAAFAVLLELRTRNIPLQPSEFFEPRPDGGVAITSGDEVRWITLHTMPETPLGPMESFVREHLGAGDEICLLEREGKLEAALAFCDHPIPGASEAVENLREIGYPVLLVSPAPRPAVARLQSELGVDHAQGESGEKEIEALAGRLAEEKLAPVWIQAGSFRPSRCAGVIALPLFSDGADLSCPSVSFPEIASALELAKQSTRKSRFTLGFVLSCQLGFTLLLAGSALFGHVSWHPVLLAVAGVIPSYLAAYLARPRPAQIALPGPVINKPD